MAGPIRKLLSGPKRYYVLAVLLLGPLVCIGLGMTVASRHMTGEYHLRQARQELQRRKFTEAYSHLTHCLELKNNSAEVQFLAARTARRAGEYDLAEHHLEECQQLGWLTESIDLERMLARAQRGDAVKFESHLLHLVEQDHSDAVLILEVLTRGYMKTYRIPQAYYCLQLWLEREPNDSQALLWHGEVSERRQSYQEAITDYRKVIQLDPARDDARMRLAEMLAHVHQPEEAAQHFALLSDSQRYHLPALLGLARCRRLLGQPEDARELLGIFLKLSPKDAGALSERGRLALETGQPGEAEHWLNKAVAAAPYERETVYALYLCLQQLGKPVEAKECLARLDAIETQLKRLRELTRKIAETPHDPALRYEAGVIFLRTGQDKEGVRWLMSALQEDPQHSLTHQALADYYQRAGDPEQADWHRRQAN